MTAGGLLIYDSDCGFCTRSARWYAARAGSVASIAPSATLDLEALGLSDHDVATSVWFRAADGSLTSGATACAEAMSAVPSAWRHTGRVLRLPVISQLADRVYWLIARNRHRLPGGTAACRLDNSIGSVVNERGDSLGAE